MKKKIYLAIKKRRPRLPSEGEKTPFIIKRWKTALNLLILYP